MRGMFREETVRIIFYKTIRKAAFVLAAVLLWDRFLNHGLLRPVRDGFLVGGFTLLAMAWFSWLKLDGVTIHHLFEERKRRRPLRHATADIVDFADEHITAYDELEPDEQTFCQLASSLAGSVLFLVPALIALLL